MTKRKPAKLTTATENEDCNPISKPESSSSPSLSTDNRSVKSFVPPEPNTTPESLYLPKRINRLDIPTVEEFQGRLYVRASFPRFVRKSNFNEMLIYTNGVCINDGQPGAKAGCAFHHHNFITNECAGMESFRLEEKGPTGEVRPQTSDRAELRAVIAALQFRNWGSDGWKQLVIATGSEYVKLGATERVYKWKQKGWKKADKKTVMNRDLWELFLEVVSLLAQTGLEISLWLIPRASNRVVNYAANKAAESNERTEFLQISSSFTIVSAQK